jgi:hypothetical protein
MEQWGPRREAQNSPGCQPFGSTIRGDISYYLCGSFLHLIGVAQVVGRKKPLCNWDNAGKSNSTGNPDCKDIPCLPPNVKRRCNQMQS